MNSISAGGNQDRVRMEPVSYTPTASPARSAAGTQTAQEAADAAVELQLHDGVHLAEQGMEAATHVGSAQNLAAQARRLGSTRDALSHGGLGVGDTEPGTEQAGQAASQAAPAAQPAAQSNVPTAMPILSEDGTIPGPAPTPDPAPAGPRTDWATRAKAAQDDADQANTIFQQMAAERQKTMMEIWKIWQDLQTSIFQMMQDTMANRAKAQEAAWAAWDAVIRG